VGGEEVPRTPPLFLLRIGLSDTTFVPDFFVPDFFDDHLRLPMNESASRPDRPKQQGSPNRDDSLGDDSAGNDRSNREDIPQQENGRAGASERLLRRIQQVARIGGWTYDSKNDTMTGTEHLFELLELPEEKELDLETSLKFYPPDARQRVSRAIQQCLREGTPFDLEVPLVAHKGTRRWVRVRGETISGEEGTEEGAERLIGTLQDVSEERQVKDTLETNQEVLRNMYLITADQEAPLPVKIRELIDLGRKHLDLPYGFLTRIEEGTQRILEARGTHPLLQRGSSCPLSRSYCRKTLEQKSLLAVRNAPGGGWASDPAYETFGLGAYIGSKVVVEGETYGTFCFAAHEAREEPFSEGERTFVELLSRWAGYELEQRRASAELKSQNDRLDRLASVVSHDLRNPLNVAQGRLVLLQETLADAERNGDDQRAEDEEPGGDEINDPINDHLGAVQRAQDRIGMIIDDMMSLTRGGQRLKAEDMEPTRLEAVAEASWDHVDAGQFGRKVDAGDEDTDTTVEEATMEVEGDMEFQADPGRLQQLLENLFRNAIEHGSGSAAVRLGPLDGGFYVEDDGPGIPEGTREQVFDASFSTREEGTGLGLSIVEAVADAHGWEVSLTESNEGGARFEITGVEEL